MTIYNFKEQLGIGKDGEARLDAWFESKGWIVEPVELEREKNEGIDRIVHNMNTSYKIEYKIDHTAERTRNAFMEMAVGYNAGWLVKTRADYVAYLVGNTIYMFEPKVIKADLSELAESTLWRTIKNEGFEAWGFLLPLKVLAEYCVKVYKINEE